MSRFRIAIAMVLGIVLSASLVAAHEEYGFVGTLVKVDLAKGRVTLKYKDTPQSKEETLVLVLTPKTEILDKDKQKVPRSTLKVGLTAVVRAWGDGDATEFDALSIRIVPAPKR